jgi:MFS family permease
MKNAGWLNRTVFGAGIASFFSDLGHEAVTALLPSLLIVLGAPVYALGIIEGVSDGASSFVKLFSGYLSDKQGKRKEYALTGYVATGIFPAIVAVATSWPMVLAGRMIGWMGRGIRGPPRDAILAKSVNTNDLGKAFGFHRAGDTLGAIVGPLVALSLITYLGTREIIWLTLIPGILAFLTFWIFVKEKDPAPSGDHRTLVATLKDLPGGFKKYLAAVLVFGVADFSHTLLIAFAVVMLTPAMGYAMATAAGIALYTLRNVIYAAASYPFGALGDRFGRKKLLAAGYAVAVVTFIGFAFTPPDLVLFAILFALCGVFIAAEDTLESAVAGELIEDTNRGLGFGTLAMVNGIGDLVSSIGIGILWAFIGYSAGFMVAAFIAAMGMVLLVIGSINRTHVRAHGKWW